MKGKKCFGLLLVLFIIFGLSLSVYSDTNAIVYTENLSYDRSISTGAFECGYRLSTSSTLSVSTNSQCELPSLSAVDVVSGVVRYMDYFKTLNTFDVSSDEYYQLRVFVKVNQSTALPLSLMSSLSASTSTDGNWQIMDVDVEYESQKTQVNTYNRDGFLYLSELYPDQTILLTFTIKPLRDGNFPIALSQPGSHLFTFSSGTGTQSVPSIQVRIVNRVYVFKQDASQEMNKKDEQDRDNMENQQSDVSSDSDSSQESADSTGTTLLGAFTGFVGAITSATPSNCNLNMDLGNLDLGVVNLCQLSLPQPLPTIASIMLILFCVPLSIATARKVINLFRSFQG